MADQKATKAEVAEYFARVAENMHSLANWLAETVPAAPVTEKSCGRSIEGLFGVTLVCVQPDGHGGSHKTADGSSWAVDAPPDPVVNLSEGQAAYVKTASDVRAEWCKAEYHHMDDGNYRCDRRRGHVGKHADGQVMWDETVAVYPYEPDYTMADVSPLPEWLPKEHSHDIYSIVSSSETNPVDKMDQIIDLMTRWWNTGRSPKWTKADLERVAAERDKAIQERDTAREHAADNYQGWERGQERIREWRTRAEAAEAKVARVEALLAKNDRLSDSIYRSVVRKALDGAE